MRRQRFEGAKVKGIFEYTTDPIVSIDIVGGIAAFSTGGHPSPTVRWPRYYCATQRNRLIQRAGLI
jgi:hypothetical protein